jgi:hypothetical protein
MVEGGIHFDGVEFRGVVRQEVTRLHLFGIEGTLPARGCECASPYAKF